VAAKPNLFGHHFFEPTRRKALGILILDFELAFSVADHMELCLQSIVCYTSLKSLTKVGAVFLMSFAILHMQKLKGQAVKGIQFHNQREKESQTNFDIDKEREHLNYDLIHGDQKINYNEKIEEIIKNGVVSDKKIRKDAVRVCGFLVTSDKAFFDNLTPDQEKDYFQSSLEFFKEKYGEENIAYATVHKDEKTPHMHVGLVPITEDGRLSAKDMFKGKVVMHKLQDDFHAHVKESGFDLERGVSSDRKHVEITRFKAETALEQLKTTKEEIQELKDDFKDGLNELTILDKDIRNREKVILSEKQMLEKLRGQLEAIQVPLEELKAIKTTNAFGKVLVDKEDFDNVSQMAQKALDKNSKVNSLRKDINELQGGFKKAMERLKVAEEMNFQYRKENSHLKTENRGLLNEITQLQFLVSKFQQLYKFVKDAFVNANATKQLEVLDRKEKELEKENPEKKRNELQNER